MRDGLHDLRVKYQRLSHAADAVLAELAGRQHGVVATWQLLSIGFTTAAIRNRVATGRLHRIHRGVYAVGHRRLTLKAHMMAAVLACGPDAVLSHRSAIGLWELRPQSGAPFDVAVPGRARRSRNGIRVHNIRRLDPKDRTTRDGIPVTSLHRAILDYADAARPQEVRLAIDAADRLEQFDRKKLQALMDQHPTRRGTKKLKAILAEISGPAPWTRSELERQFLALIRGAGIPEPQANVVVLGYQADLYWPAQRVIAELDGYDFHKGRRSFHGDRRRDTKLLIAGIRTVRITQPRIENEPAELVRDVEALLSAA